MESLSWVLQLWEPSIEFSMAMFPAICRKTLCRRREQPDTQKQRQTGRAWFLPVLADGVPKVQLSPCPFSRSQKPNCKLTLRPQPASIKIQSPPLKKTQVNTWMKIFHCFRLSFPDLCYWCFEISVIYKYFPQNSTCMTNYSSVFSLVMGLVLL